MKSILAVLACLCIALFSCKKEDKKIVDKNDTMTGTWDFSSVSTSTYTSKEFKVGGFKQKSETTLNYVTENNTGRLVITDSTITTTGLAYTIYSQIKTYNYKDDVLTDSSQKPYNLSFYEPQSFCSYKAIGSDSISFITGGLSAFSDSIFRAKASGAKIKLNGDTLMLKQYVHKDSTEVRLGVVYHIVQTGTANMTLLRHKD